MEWYFYRLLRRDEGAVVYKALPQLIEDIYENGLFQYPFDLNANEINCYEIFNIFTLHEGCLLNEATNVLVNMMDTSGAWDGIGGGGGGWL